MPCIPTLCSDIDRYITNGSLCITLVLLSLCVATVVEAGPRGRRPMTDSIEFFQDDTLEATIDFVSAIGWTSQNGLAIRFAGASIGDYQGPILTGDATFGYTVHLNTDINAIPYDVIAQQIAAQIDELSSAEVRLSVVGSDFNPSSQSFPPPTVLYATDEVPEPSCLVMITIFCGSLWLGRCRNGMNTFNL